MSVPAGFALGGELQERVGVQVLALREHAFHAASPEVLVDADRAYDMLEAGL